jgi:hypothetical protein
MAYLILPLLPDGETFFRKNLSEMQNAVSGWGAKTTRPGSPQSVSKRIYPSGCQPASLSETLRAGMPTPRLRMQVNKRVIASVPGLCWFNREGFRPDKLLPMPLTTGDHFTI